MSRRMSAIRSLCTVCVFIVTGVGAFSPTQNRQWFHKHSHSEVSGRRSLRAMSSLCMSSDSREMSSLSIQMSSLLEGVKVAIVGGGPSGLLLAHYLGKHAADVSVFERRPKQVGREQRAYALGIGRRGRTAIQQADPSLWSAVKQEGFGSERFDLHVSPKLPSLRLRDEKDGRGVEPSLLMFQSDLCRVMSEKLEENFPSNVKLSFDEKISLVDLDQMRIAVENGPTYGPFDLIVGCDGVNSVVRRAMAKRFSLFNFTTEQLAGEFKVARGSMPPKLDQSAVALLVPQSGTITAFVEPTLDHTACVLFAGRNSSDLLLSSSDPEVVASEILERFPKLAGLEQDAAQQLVSQSTARAFKVVCNTYHGPKVALVGDAAHATGGVSGQGVNSALVDSQVLAECLLKECKTQPEVAASKDERIQSALLQYSLRQVPEGAALYDLSFGPTFESPLKRLRWGLKSLVDAVFKGRFGIGELPLQTKLTTSLQPFASIRRERQKWYSENGFPSPAVWEKKLTLLNQEILQEMSPLERTKKESSRTS